MYSQRTRKLGFVMCQVILNILTVESGFRKTPSNTVAVVGQSMRMECWTSPNETTQWNYLPLGQKTSRILYNGDAVSTDFTPRFDVDLSKGLGHHDLVAKNVVMTDAGIYECVVFHRETQDRSITITATAELVVLESEPQCKINISATNDSIKEFDYVVMRCAVNCSGHWTPFMQWSKEGNAYNETRIAINSNTFNDVQHLSSVIFLQVSAEDNDATITCKAGFTDLPKHIQYTNATNAPNYSFYWNTTLNVHYGVRNVTITPRKDKYGQEDVLICTGYGNPSPSYRWRNFKTQETFAVGSQLSLSNIRINANQHYIIECIAENRIAEQIKLSSATIDIIIEETWQLPIGYIIAAGIGIFCTLLAVFIFRFIHKKLCSGKSRNKEDLAKENLPSLSIDYESVHDSEVNISLSTSATPNTDAAEEAFTESYSKFTERPVILQQPVVYSSLEATSSPAVILPQRGTEEESVYVNIVFEKNEAILRT